MEKPILLLDLDLCTGCRACMVACSLAKEKTSSLSLSRLRVLKNEPVCLAVPVICEQCAKAPCENACPVGAITRNPDTQALTVDREKCIGCKECVWACPFGAITVREGLAVKCDLCDGDPECSKVCTPGAIKFERLKPFDLERRMRSLERRVKALTTIL